MCLIFNIKVCIKMLFKLNTLINKKMVDGNHLPSSYLKFYQHFEEGGYM